MNFFIDFEATQFSNEIISIGCCSEMGGQFYSLVNTKKKITPFITDLTHITQTDVDDAPTSEAVFEGFFEWVESELTLSDKENDMPQFYCYGNCDSDFVKTNFQKTNNFKAAAALGYLYTNMIDYADVVKAHFGLIKHVALKKVYGHYIGMQDVNQRHNALDDALMLKTVFEGVEGNPLEFDVFPEYQVEQMQQTLKKSAPDMMDGLEYTVHRVKGGRTVQTYKSLAEAIVWVINHEIPADQQSQVIPKNVGKKIKHASKEKTKYMKYKWIVVEKKK